MTSDTERERVAQILIDVAQSDEYWTATPYEAALIAADRILAAAYPEESP